jgi:hypothetical protein
MTPLFTGTIHEGHFRPDHLDTFKILLGVLEGKRVQVTVEREKQKRSNQQIKYYWGVVLQLICRAHRRGPGKYP